jgi:hypothetical protein
VQDEAASKREWAVPMFRLVFPLIFFFRVIENVLPAPEVSARLGNELWTVDPIRQWSFSLIKVPRRQHGLDTTVGN